MTVADNTSRNQYSATSGQTVFAYTFEIVDKSHIVVLKNGVALSEGTNYSVSNVGNDSGGNVTLTVGATTGDVLTLYRDMPYSRTQNYTNSGDFLASEVNSDFDDLWLAGEQTDRSFSQSIRKPITDSDSISMELPEAATRANKFIKFDVNGAVDLAAGVTTDVDAEDVSIEDAGGYYTSDNVEGALQEIGAQPPGFDPNTDSFNIGSDAVSSGTDSIALGHDASATAARDIALGLDAVASGGGSIAIGQETDSTGVRSIAIGKGAQSTLSTSIAIGEDASTLNGAGGGPIAIGYSALSTGTSGISLGGNATASGSRSISIGDTAESSGNNSIAFGYVAQASGSDSIAIGRLLTIPGDRGIAIGYAAAVNLNDGVAIGNNARVYSSQFGVAIGRDSLADNGSYATALGYSSQATAESSTALGDSASATGNGSTAIGQNASVTSSYSTALGYGATVTATTAAIAINDATASGIGSMAIHDNALSSGSYSMAIGYWSQATGSSATALGYSSEATAQSSTALGHGAQATATDSISIGNDASSYNLGAIAIGADSDAARIGSIALGKDAQAKGAGSTIAIGHSATTFNGSESPIAIGFQANTTGAYGVGLGYQTVTSGAQGIAIGYIASATATDSIAIGRQLTTTGQEAIGIGHGAEASGGTSISIGADSWARYEGSIAVGKSASATGLGVPIAIGRDTASSGAYGISMGEGAIASGAQTLAIGYGAEANNDNGIAIGRQLTVAGQKAIGIGWGAVAGSPDSIGIGTSANAPNTSSISIGNTSQALGAGGVAIGGGATTSVSNAYGVAIGYAAQANDVSGIAIGNNAIVSNTGTFGTAIGRDSLADNGPYGTALGYSSEAHSYATALGSNTDATGNYSVAVGYKADSLGEDAIALGYLAGADAENTIHINASGVNTNQPQTAGYIVIETDDASLTYDGTWSLAGGALSTDGLDVTGDVTFGDNDKAIFGAGSDLQIYHSGTHSYITDTGAGNLYLGGSDLVWIGAGDLSETYATFNDDGAVTLRHDNSQKLATTTTGIDVTGTAVADGLTVSGASTVRSGDTTNASLQSTAGDLVLKAGADDVILQTGGSGGEAIQFVDNAGTLYFNANMETGDVSFYEDTGTTPKFFWDASAERLGLNTLSPNRTLHVAGSSTFESTTGNGAMLFVPNDSVNRIYSRAGNASTTPLDLAFNIGSSEAMRVTSSGNVGIGESSPDEALVVRGGNYAGNQNGGIALQLGDASGGHYKAAFKLKTASNGVVRTTIDATNGTTGGTVEAISIANATGNVGIGTATPKTALDISSGTGSAPGPELTLTNGYAALTTGDRVGAINFYTSDASGFGANNSAIIEAQAATSIGNNANLIFKTGAPTSEGADAVETMRITSNGSVGIGTANPSYNLTVAEGNTDIGLVPDGTNGSYIRTGGSDTNSAVLRFLRTGNAESMRISSGGHLLVGKTAQDSTNTVGFEAKDDGLIVATTDGSRSLILNRKTSDGTIAEFRKDNTTVGSIGTNSGSLFIGSGDTGLNFRGDLDSIYPWGPTGGARADAIDLGYSTVPFKDLYLSGTAYSDNVLVGKTSPDTTNTVGAEVQADGQVKLAADGKYPLQVNRLSSDGGMINLRKDGSIVGSIGTHTITGSSRLYVGGGDVALMFRPDIEVIQPASDTGLRDDAISLGNASGRFKDLYLSGGVYLGGSLAANKLDDYEEGTWTPVYSPTTGSFTTMTMDVVSATYTKIGDSVFVRAYIRTDDVDVTGASGSVIISGLPFASDSSSSVTVSYTDGWQQAPLAGYASGSAIYLLERSSVSSDVSNSNVGDLTDGTNANSNVLVISGTYRTTA